MWTIELYADGKIKTLPQVKNYESESAAMEDWWRIYPEFSEKYYSGKYYSATLYDDERKPVEWLRPFKAGNKLWIDKNPNSEMKILQVLADSYVVFDKGYISSWSRNMLERLYSIMPRELDIKIKLTGATDATHKAIHTLICGALDDVGLKVTHPTDDEQREAHEYLYMLAQSRKVNITFE